MGAQTGKMIGKMPLACDSLSAAAVVEIQVASVKLRLTVSVDLKPGRGL